MSNKQLLKLRHQLDTLDKGLVLMLKRRFGITKKVGEFKKKHNIPVQDKKRESEMFKKRSAWANIYGIEEKLILDIFKAIIKEVRKNHKNLRIKK